jgi:hypothetical protein
MAERCKKQIHSSVWCSSKLGQLLASNVLSWSVKLLSLPLEKKKTKQNTKLLLATDHLQLEIWPHICHVVEIILLPILCNLPVLCVCIEYKLGSWATALNVWSKFYSNFVFLGFMQDAWMDCDITETSLFSCRFIAKILANYSVNIAT